MAAVGTGHALSLSSYIPLFKFFSMKYLPFLPLVLLLACQLPAEVSPPKPLDPVPSPQQVAWQQMEMNMFIHFNMNTFTNQEWGYGNESPEQFNPTRIDCRQWARIAKAAGMKGIILTAKHHDGFCLWPSKFTEHSVKNSPWKNGNGDLVQELREACDEFGLNLGLYLSPWDRNHPDYGQPEYINYYRNQMRELLTNYGEIFEFWVDGANGGDGYYGGANEMRQVDRQTYYDWDSTFALALELQPNTIIFSDAGPGCRWVGNEEGWANSTNWSTLHTEGFYPGTPDYKQLTSGHKGGTHWVPAEVNTSIRPGWYYHPEEDTAVKSLEQLQAIYDHSLGRNGLLLLNMPVDTRGLIHPNDSARLMELAAWVESDRQTNHADNARIAASQVRGNSDAFCACHLNDGIDSTYWAVEDSVASATVTLSFPQPVAIRMVELEEYIQLGQRVEEFEVLAKVNGEWRTLQEGTTVGYRRMLRLEPLEVSDVRIAFKKSLGPVAIRGIGLY